MVAVCINGESLNYVDFVEVVRGGREVRLDADARNEMVRSYQWVQRAASGDLLGKSGESLAVYGVNTGYGSLARVRIDPSQIQELSWNLIRSHAAGVGRALSGDAVRGMMLLRANALAKGASGCRAEIVET